MMLTGSRTLKACFRNILYCSLLALTTAAVADEVLIDYIDDSDQAQILTIDANSSDADNTLAATFILEGYDITVILDEKEDLELIADAVAAHAPDNLTATAIRNTILGISALLGGRSVERNPQAPVSEKPQVDTPPVTPPVPLPPPSLSLPPPSSAVVSPN